MTATWREAKAPQAGAHGSRGSSSHRVEQEERLQQTGPWCSRQELQAPSPHRQLLMRKGCPKEAAVGGCAMTGRNRWKGSFRPIHGRGVAATGRRSWRLSAHHRLVLLPSSRSASAFSSLRAAHPPTSHSSSPSIPRVPRVGPLRPLVGRRCRRPSRIKGPACLGRSVPIQIPMPWRYVSCPFCHLASKPGSV